MKSVYVYFIIISLIAFLSMFFVYSKSEKFVNIKYSFSPNISWSDAVAVQKLDGSISKSCNKENLYETYISLIRSEPIIEDVLNKYDLFNLSKDKNKSFNESISIEKRSQIDETVVNINLPIEYNDISLDIIKYFNKVTSKRAYDRLYNSCITNIEFDNDSLELELSHITSAKELMNNNLLRALNYLKAETLNQLEMSDLLNLEDPLYIENEINLAGGVSQFDDNFNQGSKVLRLRIERINELISEANSGAYYNAYLYVDENKRFEKENKFIGVTTDASVISADSRFLYLEYKNFQESEISTNNLLFLKDKNNANINFFKKIMEKTDLQNAVNLDIYEIEITLPRTLYIYVSILLFSLMIGFLISLFIGMFRSKI